jgi:hypothetical protein
MLSEPGESLEDREPWEDLVRYVTKHAHCIVLAASRPPSERQVHA